MRIGLVIPTLNAGSQFGELLDSISNQDIEVQYKLVIDSASEDNTVELARQYGYNIVSIKRTEFDHGATRNIGLQLPVEVDVLIFLTQDIILASPAALRNLTVAFSDKQVGAVYGRQLPHRHAGVLSTHARLFNYRDVSYYHTLENAESMGIKAVFFSNSFSAYRKKALEEVGGFPNGVIFGEDVCAVAKIILAGWKICYSANAIVYHSHEYSLYEEFRRYFDIGAFHSSQRWILDYFGRAEGEGKKFVVSELDYLLRSGNTFLIPYALVRNATKFIAYQLGSHQKYLPFAVKRFMTQNINYWRKLR